jgi:cell division protein FtsN
VTPPPPPTATAAAFYSVQLAAYNSPEAAKRLVQQLVARGVDARVDGDEAPYRVRVGKYQTRAEAAKAAADLRASGHNGIITLVSPAPR